MSCCGTRSKIDEMAPADSLTLFCSLISAATFTGTMPTVAWNIKTPLYERCSHFIKANQGYRCVDHQNYGCQAEKIPNNFSDVFHCSRGSCPPNPVNLMVTYYKKRRYFGGALFTGINISWAIDTHDDLYMNLDGFLLKLMSPMRSNVIKMKVNVTQQPIDEMSKMWFRFDCFYPVPKNENWTLTVIQIPYDPKASDVGALKHFTLDNNGDLVLPPEHGTETERSSWIVDSTQVISSTGLTHAVTATDIASTSVAFTQVFPKVNNILSDPDKRVIPTYGVLIGVLAGVLVVLLSIIGICFIQRQQPCLLTVWKKGMPCPVVSKRPRVTLEKTDNSIVKCQKVLVLYEESSTEHIQRSLDLSRALTEICEVLQPSDIECKNNVNSKPDVQDMIERVDFIVIVSSDNIVKTVSYLQDERPAGDDSIVLALNALLRLGERISSKVVTVYFPEEKHLRILNGISMWCPVALPANLCTVFDWIQGQNPIQLIRADSIPDQETKLGQASMEASGSECTSVKCPTTIGWQDSGFRESGVCSWPLNLSPMIQADEADITDVHDKSSCIGLAAPCHHLWNYNVWSQNPAHSCTNHGFNILAPDASRQTHPVTVGSLNKYSICYKPPHDCNSINTDISSYVDLINSE